MKKVVLGKNGNQEKNLNRRIAIHEKCKNCSGFCLSEVRNCPLKDCNLHPYRSGEGPQNANLRNKAIRRYCLKCMNGQVGEVAKCPSKYCPLHPYRLGHLENVIPDDSVPKKRFNRSQQRIQAEDSVLTPAYMSEPLETANPNVSVPRKRFKRSLIRMQDNQSALSPTYMSESLETATPSVSVPRKRFKRSLQRK